MNKKLSKDLLDDIFSIPRDGSNIDSDLEDEDTSEVIGHKKENTEVAVTFEQKVADMQKDLEKVIETDSKVIETTEKPSVATAINAVSNLIPKIEESDPTKVIDDIFSSIISSSSSSSSTIKTETVIHTIEPEVKVEPVKEIPQLETKVEVKEPDSDDEEEVDNNANEPKIISEIEKMYYQFPNGKYMWKFKSPDKKYDYFYNEKKHVVTNMLKDKEISFQEYYEDLKSVNIDVKVDSYDTDALSRKITEVMKWRDRVKYIQLHLHAQYFGFKAFESLLKGVLARIEYVRGKQDGIVYEHMSDFVGYVAELEGLYNSAEIVSKHLDAAYASLSRQIAIAQPFQEADRYSSNNNVMPKMVTKELSRFDSLPKYANVSSEVATNDLKEAEKSVESNPRKGWKLPS